jgi:hypothetical protein
VIAGMVKAYNLPIDYVLYEMSYTNLVMYCAVLPSYSDIKKNAKDSGNITKISADNPKNKGMIKEMLEIK